MLAGHEAIRWGILGLITLAHTLGSFTILSLAPLSPLLLDSLHLSRAQVGLLLPAIYLGGIIMTPTAGWLTDRLGVRLTLVVGQGLTGAMFGLAGRGPDFPALLALLFLSGFGWSVLNPASGKAILEWFQPRERGLAMGVKQTGLTLGGIAAALVLPPLAVKMGWARALWIAASSSILSALLVGLAYRTPRRHRAEPPADRPRLAEVATFLRRPGLLVVFGCGLALSVAQASVLAYLALYARDSWRVSAVEAGRLLALAQAGGAGARLGWGIVSDRFFGGRRRPGLVVTALVGAATYAIFSASGLIPLGRAALLAIVTGVGAFGWVGLYLALVAEIGGPRHAGLLTGVAVAFAWSGVLVGPLLFGLVLEATGSYTLPWLGLSALAVLVAATLLRLRPLIPRSEQRSA